MMVRALASSAQSGVHNAPNGLAVLAWIGCLCGLVCVGTVWADQDAASQVDSASDSESTPDTVGAEDDFLRAYAETYRFRLGLPSSIEMTPKGDAIFFLRSGGRSFVRDLYVYETGGKGERKLLTAEDLLGGAEEELTAEEKARRERMRLAARGFASYSLSGDGESILAPLSGRLFVVRWREGSTKELPVEGGFPIDPRFSPDGTHVAYSADGDLWVVPVAGGAPRKLTSKDGAHVSNGVPEFAAQEEMDRDHGYWWSPDGTHIAYQRNDDAALQTFHIADPFDPSKAPKEWRYPRAGTANTDVRLAIVPLAGGAPVWVDWDREAFPYLATVKWDVEDAPLTIVVQDRAQQEEIVFAVDTASGETTELLRETDEAWLNLDQQMPRWLPGGERFLWTTERGGAWQLELRTADGGLERTLTDTNLGYRELEHVDMERGILTVAAQPSAVDTQIYEVRLDGEGPVRTLTGGPGTREMKVSDSGLVRVQTEQSPDEKPRFFIRDQTGNFLDELGSEQEWPALDLHASYERLGLDPYYHAVVIRPDDFDAAKKYPVIVHVYGGPHKQMVRRLAQDKLLDQWLANQGFVVVSIDGRGTPARGRAWERAIRGNLIDAPLQDHHVALVILGDRFPELDLERVGIYGWSFGGYFSAMALMRKPELFRAGVAGAPVTEWEDYDTHYTERYLGHPEKDPEAYRVSNVLTYAGQLERPLLILHGTADDNVYFVHGLKMSNALTLGEIDHEFVPLAGQTHMVTDPDFVSTIYRRHVDFFRRHLGQPE